MKTISAIFSILIMASLMPFTVIADESLNGKTIVVLGDSYVRNHKDAWSNTWHARVADKLGMYYLNYGRNGSSIAFDRTAEGFGPAMTERYKSMPKNADYILIIAGHNDASRLGATPVVDEALWNTFCNSLDTLLTGMREKYPEAKMGFVTPWGVERPMFSEVIAEIHKACDRHGISVFDTSALGIIEVNNPDFRKQYFQRADDTAHLNSRGHALLLEQGESFIKSL